MIEIARNYSRGPTKRRQISSTQKITQGYIENILGALKAHKFVGTVRGADGGFVLLKPPEQITLYDIVTALEGSISPVDCLDNADACDMTARCVARTVWQKLADAQKKVLSEVTLRDMVEMESGANGSDFTI